ncbi:MAG: tetratricopeptide repeat protein [Acidobacteria bacterium]|nr:tetratricopeptide repeat protein [Acidobacteriota bacterium]
MKMRSSLVLRSIPVTAVMFFLALPPVSGAAEKRGEGAVRARAEAYYFYLRAQDARRSGAYKQSSSLLEKSLRSDPGADSISLEIAEIYILQGEMGRAEKFLGRFLEKHPDSAEAHKILAEAHLRQIGQGNRYDHIDSAIDEYLQALRLQTNDVDGTLQLGTLYRNVGRTEEAIRLLVDFRGNDSGSVPINLLLANTLLQIQEKEQAEEILFENLVLDPANPETVDMLAGLFESEERFDEAIALYEKLVELMEPSHYLQARLGYLNLLAKRFPPAVEFLQQARQMAPLSESILINLSQALEEVGDLPAAADVYEDLLRTAPGNRGFLYHLARLLAQIGRFGEAERMYLQLAADLEGSGIGKEEVAESATICYLQLGSLYLQWKRPKDAVRVFQKAMKYSSGERKDVYLYLSRAYLEAGQFDSFWKILERSEGRFPDDNSFSLLRGEAFLREGRPGKGIQHLRSLWQGPGVDREVFLRMADMLITQKEFVEAVELLSRGLELFPEDDMMFFQMGALQERQGSFKKAENSFRQALVVNPENPLVLNYFGYMLVEQGSRLEESLKYIKRAVEIDPYNPAYLDSLGWAYFKLQRLEPARNHLEEASRLSGGDPVIEDHLGDLYFQVGEDRQAITAWNRALAAGIEDPATLQKKIEEAKRRLEGSR